MIDRLRAIIGRPGDPGEDSKTIGFFVGSTSLSIQVATIAKVLMAVVVVSATTLVVGLAFLGVGTQPAFAVSVSASDINISTADGNLTSVTITPNMTYSWNNVDSGVYEIKTDVEVSNDGSTWYTSVTDTYDCSFFECGAQSTTVNNDITTLDIAGSDFGQTSAFSLSDFNASDGQTKTTTVYVRLTARLLDENGAMIETTQVEKSFDVTVTNKEGTLSLSGELNTSATTPTS